jgi:putative membrane protein insertion efficiency factor
MSHRMSPPAWLLTQLVRGYQLVLSPLLGPRCRFYPSCSAYAVEALTTHGPVRGLGLAAWRLLRCHPWNPGGVDHVPERSPSRPASHSAHAHAQQQY